VTEEMLGFRSSVFWDAAQRQWLVCYRRFGTTDTSTLRSIPEDLRSAL